jgi:hypothetical protein
MLFVAPLEYWEISKANPENDEIPSEFGTFSAND